jgi:hypothetical protein
MKAKVFDNPFFSSFTLLCALALLLWGVQFGASFIASLSPYAESSTISTNVENFEELSDRFSTVAQEKGALYAFEVLRRASLPAGTDLHLLGHTIGEIWYEQSGIEGMAKCTPEFHNACSHTIVIGALSEYGESALGRIREACTQAPGGAGAYTMCYHGLGHGVFAYFGYSLPETIQFCKKTGTAAYQYQEYTECVGGAVMELMGGGGHDREQWLQARKKYLTQNPLSPCMGAVMPAELQGVCLTYITPRLFEEAGADLFNPNPAIFPEALGFCNELTQSSLRKACFGGFGKEFVPLAAARDIRALTTLKTPTLAKAAGWCTLTAAQDGQDYCVADALSSLFWGGENDPDASFKFCAAAPKDIQSACYQRLAEEISRYIPERSALCAALPAEFQSTCISSEYSVRSR